ncbi:hypothetical protein [Cyclobacterium plantarum]|uniref:Uncharacterized protein n=1 Tax=Cyclobacterium plantarum TaxID=2716263 RepID=A0ABX0H820_9BACT|nr:hypothetical protein [Cyclobacterium plantarum]NHE56567.1 hypothetical protein [Cyclobacterium plantarum]
MLHTGYKVGSDPTFGVERDYVQAKKITHFWEGETALSNVSDVVDDLLAGKGMATEKIPATDPAKVFICRFAY